MLWNRKKTKKLEYLSPEKIKTFIKEFPLPQIVMDLFNATCSDKRTIHLLGDQYQAPYCLLDIPLNIAIEQYRVNRYISFLAIFQSTILAYDLIGKGFVSYSIEYFK